MQIPNSFTRSYHSFPVLLTKDMKSTLSTASGLSQLPLAKELSPTVNTSLDLSINSFRHLDSLPAASPSPKRRARHGINQALNREEGIKEDNNDLDTRTERPAAKDDGTVSVEEFDRIVSENKKLTELLSTMYADMRTQNVMDPKSTGHGSMTARKRKYFEDYEWTNVIGTWESSMNCDDDMYRRVQETGRTKVFRVHARVDPSDVSLIVKDGYHWRKYGQKVTRDNPSPRAYFKCSFAPSCPVKKKVQRSVGDPSLLVATYEGRHNHHSPTQRVTMLPNCSSPRGYPKPILGIPDSPTVTIGGPSTPSAVLDLVQPPGLLTPVAKQPVQETNRGASVSATDGFPRLFVQQMASSLTRDPSFTAALAAAISGWILDQEPPENR